MSKKISSNPSVVKIAHAAKVLGVHKDTLRRWEKAGKIQVRRDQKGVRLYDISDLVKIIPADEPSTASPVKISYPPTADLLKSAQIHLQNIFVPPRRPPGGLNLVLEDNKRTSKNWRVLAGFCIFVFLSVAGVALYLRSTHIPYSKPTQQKNLFESEVLGETTAQATVKINANEKVSGSLVVDSDINGMKLAVSPVSGEGFSISANEATINARGAVTLNQDLSTTASPTFAGLTVKSPIKAPSLGGATLNLTGSSNQVVFNYESSSKGTLTWTPTAARTITLPDATDTLVGKATTDTLSNKTLKSGDSNTVSGSFTSITGLGTITTGTWNGTKIGIGYGGTNLTSYTTGDILYASATDTLSKLTVGSSGQVLTLSSGIPAWSTVSATGVAADSLDFSEFKDSMTLDATTNIATAGYNLTTSGSGAISFNNTGNVGIGTSAAGSTLAVNGNEVIGWGTTSIAGPTNGLAVFGNLGIGTTSPSVMLDVRGATIIAPTSSAVALRVNAAPSGSNNILEVLNTAGTSTYFSIDSSGQLSGSAFQITDANNAIVGTAIPGGWTMNSNTFTYRRIITITNSSGSTLPKYYEISIAMNNSDSNQTYGKSQQSSPYKDFRTAWYNGGGTITEIARNVSSFTSSDISFSFQLSANISNGSSDTYYIYYGNSSLATTPSTYTGNTQLDSADTVANWTSGDDGYTLSQETTIKQEGTGSVKAVAAIGNLGTGSTASQGQLLQTLTGLSVVKATISSTDYAYVLGGNNGTSDQTTVYKSTISSGNVGVGSTASQGQLPQNLSGLSAVSVITASPLSGYSYKKQLTITASTDALSSGYSVNLTFNHAALVTATKSLASGDDIRVVYYNGSSYTEIDRVLDDSSSWNNASTQIWFKTQAAISASGSDNNYYLYYGNTSAVNPPTNKSNIWAFWDNFDDGSYSSAWTVTGGSWSESGTTLTGTAANSFIDTSSFTLGDGEYTVNAKTPNLALGLYPVNIDANNYGYLNPHSNGNLYHGLFRSGSNLVTSPCSTWSWDSNFHTFKVITYQNVWKVYLDGTLKCDTTPTYTNYSSAKTRLYSESGAAFDWIKVRKYVATDSSISVSAGNEDSSSSQNLFVLGGSNGGTAQSTVYKSSFDGSANVGTFSTTSQSQLPQALYGHSTSTFTISSTPYIYVIGGNAGTEASRNVQLTVYKSTIDSSGNVGAFGTGSQTQLSSALYYHGSTTATIGGTNYVYILGGLNSSGTAQTTVYKATVDGSANVSAITSTGQSALPQALSQLQALVVATGSDNYIYAIGGKDSSGNAVTAVYKASLDSSGNVGSWSATGQGVLPQALYGHGAFTASSGGTNYVYVLGGQNTAVRDTVYKAQVNDMSSYTATKTLSSTNLSNKNDLQWKYYSSATGSYMALEFSEDGSTWQTCSFSVSSASTWETKTCDISAIASASRDAVTRVRFRVTSNQTSTVTSYFDDIQGVMNATTITNTTSYGRSILGASNLAVNAQGTGLVTINYAASPAAAAGSGGFAVYNGTTNALFTVGGSGNVGIGFTGPARLNIIGTGTSTALTLLTQGSGSTATFGLAILDSGNVGIGTTNPLGKLVILGGNVGIGTSSPNATLSIQGNLGIGYTGLNQAIPSNGLAVFGNVGIGTTTANSNLSIAGNAHIGSIRQGISAPTDGLFVDGNVGIGATTSNNKLDVWGNTRLAGTLTVDSTGTFGSGLIGYSGVTAPASGLAISGNLGVGTTSPLGALHVVGQCVAWDTRIRIRRRRSRNKFGMTDDNTSDGGTEGDSSEVNAGSVLDTAHLPGVKAHLEGEWDYLEVMIKDILPGDEVLSLNENTQEFEYQRVEKLLDMGLKGVYELTTTSGRTIKTTANHPYLTKFTSKESKPTFEVVYQSPIKDAGWVKVINLSVGDQIAVAKSDLAVGNLLKESKVNKHQSNHTQEEGNGNSGININNIEFLIHRELLNTNDIAKQTIAPNTSTVNIPNFFHPFSSEKLGTIIIAANQPADTLINRSAITDFTTGLTISTKYQTNIERNVFQWDEIVSIKYLGYEHVYDLQIENTHNFLANDIVAHNTAIFSGNVGIGVTSPTTFNLQVAGSIGPNANDTFDLGSNTARWNNLYLGPATLHLGTSTSDEYTLSYDTTNNRLGFNVNGAGPAEIVMDSSGNIGIGTTNPGSALAVIGNVGIGTSSAGANLAVNGNAVIGWGTTGVAGPVSGLAVSGNVGIGTTSPTALLQIQGTGSMPSLLVTSSGNVGIGTSVTANPLTVGIDGGTGNGAYLTTGGVWTNGSSIEFKENFTALNDAEILDKINQLPILQWNYKIEDPSIKHIGPIAEDFYAIFGVGNDSKHISTIDPAGVALAGIKALIAQQASMSAILANLSVSDDGTLNVPRLKAGSIILDPSIASASGQLTANSSSVILNASEGSLANASPTSVGDSSLITQNDNMYYDLTGKIASLEDRIKKLENVIASERSSRGDLTNQIATGSANPRNDNIAGEATSSAENTPDVSSSTSGVENLNLTPPDILLATGSVTLANLNVTSEATFSGLLTAYQAEIQNHFKVFGDTTLSDTLIAGNLTVDGTLSIENGSEINVIGYSGLQGDALEAQKGVLYLQKSPFAQGLDIFNGLVTITSDGQITAQAIQSDKLILSREVLGSNLIKAGTNEVVVETPAVTDKSKIFVTAQTEIDTVLFVTDKIIGQSFKVKTKVPALSDIIFDWSILDSP